MTSSACNSRQAERIENFTHRERERGEEREGKICDTESRLEQHGQPGGGGGGEAKDGQPHPR